MKEQILPIKTNVPPRPEGQQDALLMTAPKLETVRVGFIGLGRRGPDTVKRFIYIDGAEIVALCDIDEQKVERCQTMLRNAGKPQAASYSGSSDAWKQLCESADVDLVYIITNWDNHAEIALYAMQQGKHVAVEVPGAMTLEDIWKLVDTSERTRKHCMMLENSVYDSFELTTLNMAQHHLFGEIVHTEGAYIHNLEEYWDSVNHWRLEYNKEHRGDIYPTHGIAPICQLLNIHRGDKMSYLVSIDTNAVGGINIYKKQFGNTPDYYKNGDHTITLIKTEKGKTMQIQHNIVNPRPYSRMYQLTGTDGFANKYPVEGYCFRSEKTQQVARMKIDNINMHEFVSEELKKELMLKYKSPIHRQMEEKPAIFIDLEEKGKTVNSHDDMSFIMEYRLIYCLRNGLPLDMDVYDLAEWSCLVELTATSIENGSLPVEIPDFTRGSWDKIEGYKQLFV